MRSDSSLETAVSSKAPGRTTLKWNAWTRFRPSKGRLHKLRRSALGWGVSFYLAPFRFFLGENDLLGSRADEKRFPFSGDDGRNRLCAVGDCDFDPCGLLMRTIWKFSGSLEFGTRLTMRMPKGAEILHIDAGMAPPLPEHPFDWQLLVWALVEVRKGWDTDLARFEERNFYIAATGGDVEELDLGTYLTTVFVAGGELVWHIFEMPPS